LSSSSSTNYDHPDVTVLDEHNKKIILIGTAHISKESTTLVNDIISREHPDHVCIELDENRFKVLSEKKQWQSLNILQIIKKKQLGTLMVSMILSSYQKKLGKKLGVAPGTELLEAAQVAQKHNIPFSLCDRDVRITMKRALRKTPFFKKMLLMATLFTTLFDRTEISEELLTELKNKDSLSLMMDELAKVLPTIKKVLIDERDIYLSEKIKEVPGKKIVAVVGAGHVKGIINVIKKDNKGQLEEITRVPPPSSLGKILGWSIPVAIISSVIALGYFKGMESVKENVLYWILANGIFCAAGALAALAHPLTILTAFVAAPLTSLTPVIGAGYVTALVQVLITPPRVMELETISEDIYVFSRWWRSRVLKVFLAFLLPGFGSMIGTYVGGYGIISNLF